MATGLTNNKAWYNRAYVSVSKASGSEVQLRSFTTSLSVSGGQFDIEGLEVFGGKITRVGAKEDIEISFDGIPASTQDFDWIAHGQATNATSITTQTDSTFRVTLLWTDESGITSAAQAIATASEAYRQVYANAYCLGVEYNMDAGEELTATLNFKLAFEDETGSTNWKKEMCDTTSALSALAAFTTTTKW